MGIQPATTIYGDDCLLCFAADRTPLTLKVCISGIERTDFWNPFWGYAPNGYHDMLQDNGEPCRWWKDPYVIPRGWYMHHVGHSHLHWQSSTNEAAFISVSPGPCAVYFENDNLNAPGNGFWKGSAVIVVAGTAVGGNDNPPVNLAKIITDVTPMIDPDPRMECFAMPGGMIAVRYAGKRDATNIMIKFDTTA